MKVLFTDTCTQIIYVWARWVYQQQQNVLFIDWGEGLDDQPCMAIVFVITKPTSVRKPSFYNALIPLVHNGIHIIIAHPRSQYIFRATSPLLALWWPLWDDPIHTAFCVQGGQRYMGGVPQLCHCGLYQGTSQDSATRGKYWWVTAWALF